MKSTAREKKSNKKSYIGIVVSRFKVKGKLYLEGDKYECGSKFSYDHLKSINKIK